MIVALTIAITILSAAAIPRIQLQLDGRSLIPNDHPWMADSDREAERFSVRDFVILGVEAERPLSSSPEAVAFLADLTEKVGQIPGIEPASTASVTSVPRLVVESNMLQLRPLIDNPDTVDAATAQQLLEEAKRLGWNNGLFVSENLHAAAILARIKPDADRYSILRAVDELVELEKPSGVEVFYTGNALAQAVLGLAAATDLTRLVPLVLVVLTILLIIAFRHAAPALICLAEVGASLLITSGLMGLTQQSVFVTTLALPVVLVVIGVSDDLYVLHSFFDRRKRERGAQNARVCLNEVFGEVGAPVVLTGLTTGAGLLCLTLPGLEPLRVFGLFGAIAVLVSTILTFTLVPALLVLVDPQVPARGVPTRALGRWLVDFMSWALGRFLPAPILIAAILFSACGTFAALRYLQIGDNWIRNLPEQSRIVEGDRRYNETFAGTNTLDVAVSTFDSTEIFATEAFRAISQFQSTLLAAESVGAAEGPSSASVRVAAALEESGVETFRNDKRFRKFVTDDRALQEVALLQESLRRSNVPLRWNEERTHGHITLFVRSADYGRIAELLELVRTSAAEATPPLIATPFGEGWVGYVTVRLLVEGQVRSILFAIGFDLLLLTIFFRSFRCSVLAVAPVVAAVTSMFGLLAASGAQLGAANSMFAAISLGVGVDFAIHLVARLRPVLLSSQNRVERCLSVLQSAAPPILLSSSALAAGFALLSVSEVLPNRQLGLLVAGSMLLCSIMALVVIPAGLLLTTPKEILRADIARYRSHLAPDR